MLVITREKKTSLIDAGSQILQYPVLRCTFQIWLLWKILGDYLWIIVSLLIAFNPFNGANRKFFLPPKGPLKEPSKYTFTSTVIRTCIIRIWSKYQSKERPPCPQPRRINTLTNSLFTRKIQNISYRKLILNKQLRRYLVDILTMCAQKEHYLYNGCTCWCSCWLLQFNDTLFILSHQSQLWSSRTSLEPTQQFY